MIALPYLLVLNIPLHWHAGNYWADPLWKKDLEAHRAQISHLSIACPVARRAPPKDWKRLSASGITVHPLPGMGRLSPLLSPLLAVRLWQAISGARIVHVGVAGWPFPLGWLAIPIARVRRRPLVVVVESAFWRIPPNTAASFASRVRAALWESVNRLAVAACHVSFFTTRAYLDELHAGARGVAHVLPAVWIDEDQLIDRARLSALEEERRGRFLFAGRLTPGKGVDLLLQAIEQSGVAVDIVGEGELRDAVLAAALRQTTLVRLIDPVDYGPAFTALLDGYAALVVPTITDEQPRVIFDAFARGVTVLASATNGNRQIIEHGHDGLLFTPGDMRALADTLLEAHSHPERIAAMGRTALDEMAGRTHAAMHASRARAITDALSSSR